MAGRSDWVLLAYRLPREPSNPRVVLWRKLRRLGAAQIIDGLVALPADARTQEQIEWLAESVVDAGGVASIWVGRAGSARQERELVAQMTTAIVEDYEAVLADVVEARAAALPERRRTLARLRREIRRITARDYFPPPIRDRARAAVEVLAREKTVEALR